MKTAAITALIPIQSATPTITRINRAGVSLDLYLKQNRNGVVYTMSPPDDSEGIYGPDGRKIENHKNPWFIDAYV